MGYKSHLSAQQSEHSSVNKSRVVREESQDGVAAKLETGPGTNKRQAEVGPHRL